MNIALDTNRYTDYFRGVADVVERLRTADVIALPFVVLGELVLQHGMTLFARDRHFEHLPQLALI